MKSVGSKMVSDGSCVCSSRGCAETVLCVCSAKCSFGRKTVC